MYDTDGPQAETTKAEERKPPTLADIVREKTDDGRLIIDFFTDVMQGRIEGAELCHRMDAAKELVKYGSKESAKFIAKYRGIPCGHSIRGRRDSADPCSTEERSLVPVTLNTPATLTREFLTVLSRIDEFLMARLIRAQTADGGTIIEFLDDVMQDRNEGFKVHHRIAAAKELIVHIVRDEQPESFHAEPLTSVHPEPVEGPVLSTVEGPRPEFTGGSADSSPVAPAKEPIEGSVHPEPVEGAVLSTVEGPELVEGSAHPEPVLSTVEGPELVEGSAHPEPVEGPVLSTVEGPEFVEESAHPEPVLSTVEGSQLETTNSKLETLPVRPRTRRTRKQRRQAGAARAAMRRKAQGSERIEERKDEKPAPVDLTPAERRIRERLEQRWHEPDPYGAPIDSSHTGRSPPW